MKNFLRITGWTALFFLIIVIGYGLYTYQSDPWLQALANNDESKIFYRPSTEIQSMEDLDYSENTLQIADSIKIYTYLFYPKKEPRANVFLIRGNSGNVSTGKKFIQPLVENGFRVYSFDWRGYGKSNGVPTYLGIMTDTEAAFDDFTKKTLNDSIGTIVYGMSLGGQLAVKITKDNLAKVDALVLDGTLESAHSFIVDNLKGSVWKLLMKNPEDYNQDYIAVRDIAEIKDVPKLIIQSNNDRAVPFERGQHVFGAATKPKVFWETNTEHIETLEVLPEQVIEKMNALIKNKKC